MADQTIEEMESNLAASSDAPKVTDVKLDGEGIPDDLKGKSVAELIAMQKGLADSLKLSEFARMQAQTAAPAPVAPAPTPDPDLTDEQLAELYQENPVAAMRKMQEQATRQLTRNMEARIGSLSSSTAVTIEQQMRTKYAEEFDALGSEISAVIQQRIPDKSMLSDPNVWEEMIRYVKGANFDKFYAYKQSKSGSAALASARAREDAAAGISFAPSAASAAPVSAVGELDDYSKEIARNLGMSEADYRKWSQV